MKNMTKQQWKTAWSQTRALQWGTLHFSNSATMAELCRDAYNGRNAQTMTAKQFANLGFYGRGFKRI
jgi:hypothetical protein